MINIYSIPIRITLSSILLIITCLGYSQPNCNTRTFTTLPDVIYAPKVTIMNPNNGKFSITGQGGVVLPILSDPKMRIYVPNRYTNENPDAYSVKKFPVFIYCHGANQTIGGAWDFLPQEMAKRGYLSISMNFSLDPVSIPPEYGLFYNAMLAQDVDASAIGKKKFHERNSYSGAMDVARVIQKITENANVWKADINKIVIGGHSVGAQIAMHALFVDKDEIQIDFNPATFYTDPRYLDLNPMRANIKCGYIIDGGITDVNYIDINENIPLFDIHGTWDNYVPFYFGKMGCLANDCDMSGGAKIAERLSALNFNYYFIKANGLPHTPMAGLPFGANNPVFKDLWFPDLLRFAANNIYFPNTINRVFKTLFPSNTTDPAKDYCLSITANPQANCYNVPTLNIQNLSWTDNYGSFNCSMLPAIFNYLPNSEISCVKTPSPYNLRQTNPNPTPEKQITNLPLFYPNPTIGKININLKLEKEINGYNVEIFSTDGRSIYNNSVNEKVEADNILQKEFDISNHPNGIYFIRVTSENNILLNKSFVLSK